MHEALSTVTRPDEMARRDLQLAAGNWQLADLA